MRRLPRQRPRRQHSPATKLCGRVRRILEATQRTASKAAAQSNDSICQLEDEQRAALRARCEYPFACMPKEAWWGLQPAGDDRNVLPTVEFEGDSSLADPRPGVKL